MKKRAVLLFAFILLFMSFNVSAYQADINLESKFGDLIITDTISGTNLKEESTLPLKTIMLKANFNQYIFKEWADFYSVTLGGNFINTSTEDTKIINYTQNINNKNTRLKGETNLDSLYFDFLLANYLLDYSTPKQSFLILIGFEYDSYSYETENGSSYDYATDTQTNINNKILSQKVKNHIPYLGIIFNKNFTNNIKNRFVIKFSPYTYTNISSNNYYDDYTIDSTNSGTLLSVKDNVRYSINKDMYLTGGAQYKLLTGDGSGTRYYYSGPSEGTSINLDSELELEEYSLNIGIQYLF